MSRRLRASAVLRPLPILASGLVLDMALGASVAGGGVGEILLQHLGSGATLHLQFLSRSVLTLPRNCTLGFSNIIRPAVYLRGS